MPPPSARARSLAPAIPSGTIMIGGWGDSPTFAFLSPDGATSYPQPASVPVHTAIGAFCRTTAGHIGVCGEEPHFPETASGLLNACDLSIRSEYTGTHAIPGFCLTADALGYWYTFRLGGVGIGDTAEFARLDAASAVVASWAIPLPARYPGSSLWAMAVSDDGQTAYAWLQPDAITLPPPADHLDFHIHVFSLAGAGAYVGALTGDYNYNFPSLGSLLVVPGSGDIIASFRRLNGTLGTGAIRRYTPAGTLVWTAGTPAGAGTLNWMCLAHGVPAATHFLAFAYDTAATTSSSARYCWFSYATGTPDNTRNFTPENGAFAFDSQFVVLTVPPCEGGPPFVAPESTFTARHIRRLRRAPHVNAQNTRVVVRTFELDLERGQGLSTGQGRDPIVLLRLSRDGGQTWGEELRMQAGALGAYTERALARRLGHGRDLVFEVTVSDPIAWSLVGAWLDVEPGSS